ncbi:MAG TPA: ATPase, T2SS/T4P/T4SS family [Verrucomicrobiae bacterium]|nr:ATPase, T2SS/T4P/T4SS family [Verrucomicrobiae bacterium]
MKTAKSRRETRKGPPRNVPSVASPVPGAEAEVEGEAGGAEILTMDQAIALLRTTRPTFYRWLRAGKIKSMKVGRQWRFRREDVDRFMNGEQPRIELTTDITPLIKALNDALTRSGVKEPSRPDSNPVVQAVNLMARLGLALRATDLHIEPQHDGKRVQVYFRYRVDGVLHAIATGDIRLLAAIVEQWKRMAGCDVQEKTLPQDGQIRMDADKETVDMRVCFLPSHLGEAVSVRFMMGGLDAPLDLDRLGYAPRDRQKLDRWLASPSGVILVTGPTGCGKTTLTYSCLNRVVNPRIKVMTIEDPVEVVLPGVTQVGVNSKADITFPRAMRSVFRTDPDIVYVGEIRDAETLQLCLQGALTGHLVFTVLHTDEAVTALTRMVNVGAAPFVVTDATKLIIAQRLIRKVCMHCSVATEPAAEQINRALEVARAGGGDVGAMPRGFRKAVGCAKCGQTGYQGRTVIAEMLEVTPEIGAALRRGADVDELRTIAVGQGMTTMAADGIGKAVAGLTTLDEVCGVLALR